MRGDTGSDTVISRPYDWSLNIQYSTLIFYFLDTGADTGTTARIAAH
jgi:hypothetical protein